MIQTRRARLTDLPDVMPQVRAFYAVFEFPWSEDRKRQLLEELLARPDLGQLWVILRDEEIVGYALVAFWFSLEFDGRTALLDELYVAPEARGRGVGNAVLEVIEAEVRSLGRGIIRLEVDPAHPQAASLYARRGYVPSGRTLWMKQLE